MPEAEPFWIALGPSWKSDTVDVPSGVPWKMTAASVPLEALPVTFKLVPWRKPDAERLVPEAVVKTRSDVETLPIPMLVPEAELNVN